MLPSAGHHRGVRHWEDPFGTLQREFGRLMGHLGDDTSTHESEAVSYPVDIHEDANNIYVEAEMPGFKKDEVQVAIDSGVLRIAGDREVKTDREGTKHVSERRYTQVRRAFTLPSTVDGNSVTARLEDGVLFVTLSKRPDSQPHRVEIE